jgi:hypothetical protein
VIDDDLDLELEPGVVFDTETEVVCPYCGEPVVIGVDAGGGTVQDYVEDCAVCCRPWVVNATFRDDGGVDVLVEPEGE